MLNPQGLRQRAAVLHAVRTTFARWGYLEVPTPVLVACPAVEPTLHAVRAEGGWLRTSPELALKRVVASGLGRVYEIGPCMREREISPWHGREFTMLEWYRVQATLPDLMTEVETLVGAAANALGVPCPGPWRRVSFRELFLERTGCDAWRDDTVTISPDDPHSRDDAILRRWVADVEPSLTTPTIIYNWPASMAALARIIQTPYGAVAARFEAYLGGLELCNAFWELRDPQIQRTRIEASDAARCAQGEPVWPQDHAFMDATSRLPPCAGIALGLDRLVAALAGWPSIAPGRVESLQD